MGLDDVIKAVREDADREAERILSEAKAEADKLVKEAEQKASDITSKAEANAQEEAEALRTRMLASARLDAKKHVLEAQAQIIEELREATLQQAASLSGDARKDAIKALLEQSEVNEGRVRAPEQDAKTYEALGFEVVGETDTVLGCIVEGDGFMEDLTLEMLLEQRWSELSSTATKRFFGES